MISRNRALGALASSASTALVTSFSVSMIMQVSGALSAVVIRGRGGKFYTLARRLSRPLGGGRPPSRDDPTRCSIAPPEFAMENRLGQEGHTSDSLSYRAAYILLLAAH